MNRSRTAFAVGLAVPLLVLSGCSSDDPQPKIAPPETTAPTQTTSPSTSQAPNDPQEVFRAWIESRNDALTTGNTIAVRRLSASDCESCDGLINPIEKIYGAGGHFDTDGWSVVKAKVRKSDRASAVIDAGINIAGGETVSQAGEQPLQYPAEKHIVVFKLRSDPSGWVVSFVGFLS